MKRKIMPKPINMIMKLSRQEDALNEATQGLLKGRLAGAEALVRARGAAMHVKYLQMRRLALALRRMQAHKKRSALLEGRSPA